MATHLQSRAAPSNSDPQSLAYSGNVTPGSLLVVAVRDSASQNDVTVSDTRSNTWTKVYGANGNLLYCAINSAAAAGADTVTVSSTGSAVRFTIHEYGGLVGTGTPYYGASFKFGTSVLTTSVLTKLSAGDLVFVVLWSGIDNSGISSGSGFTSRGSGMGSRVYAEDKIDTGTGSYSDAITFGSGDNANSLIVGFYAAATGGIGLMPGGTEGGMNSLSGGFRNA